jgi:hypothetical protein
LGASALKLPAAQVGTIKGFGLKQRAIMIRTNSGIVQANVNNQENLPYEMVGVVCLY